MYFSFNVYFLICCVFFFFQAEDGIRDWSVTGADVCSSDLLSVRGLKDAGARQEKQGAEARGREVDAHRVVRPLGGDRLGDVVMVDQSDFDLAVRDRVADRDVVGV